jgi:hypothetical protein
MTSAAKFLGEQRPELQHRSSDRFIGDANPRSVSKSSTSRKLRVVKGGWHIAEYVTRSYDVEGMHAGTVAAGCIGLAVLRRLKPFGMHLHPRQRAHSPLRARQDHDRGRLDDDARPCDDEPGLQMMLTSGTLWGLCSYFLPAIA